MIYHATTLAAKEPSGYRPAKEPEPVSPLLIPSIAFGIALAVIFGIIYKRRARARFLLDRGFHELTPEIGHGIDLSVTSRWGSESGVEYLSYFERRLAGNVIKVGDIDSYEAGDTRAFRREPTEDAMRRTDEIHQTVFGLEAPEANAPRIWLRAKNLVTDIFRRDVGKPEIKTGNADFDRRYFTAAADEASAREFLDDELRAGLLGLPGLALEAEANNVVLYSPRGLLTLAELKKALELVEKLDRKLRR